MAWSWLGCLSFGGLLELEELKAEGAHKVKSTDLEEQ